MRVPEWLASAMRWGLVAIVASSVIGLLSIGFDASADQAGPLAIVACLALAVLVGLESFRPRLSPKPLLVVAGLLLLVAVAVPPRTSHDLWSYAMYGRIVAVHHADPYSVLPSAFPHDPALQRVDPVWRSAPSVYGPVFTGLSTAISWVTGDHPLPTRLAYQGMAALAVGITLLALARRPRRTAAIAAIGLNPAVVVALVNGGHNDAVVGLLLLGAALAVVRRRPALGALLAAVASLIKIAALLPALALLVWIARRHGVRPAAVAGGVLAGTMTFAYGLAGGVSALQPLAAAAHHISRTSMWWLFPLSDRVGHRELVLLVVLVGVPAAVLTLARLRDSPIAAAAAGVTPYLLAGPYVLPWYFAWALPIVAFADDRPLSIIVFAETLLVEIAYTYRVVASPDTLDRFLRWSTAMTQRFEVLALAALTVGAVYVLLLGAYTGARRVVSSRSVE